MHISARLSLPTVVLVAALVAACNGGAERHEDGEGAVQSSPGTSERFLMGADRPDAVWTYGLFLCTTQQNDPPRLVEVTPTGLVGATQLVATGFLGEPSKAGEMISTAQGYPPEGPDPDAIVAVTGQDLEAPCGPGVVPSQVLIAIRLGPDGDGGFTGQEVVYDQGGRRQTLALHNMLLFCRPETDSAECRDDLARQGEQASPLP